MTFNTPFAPAARLLSWQTQEAEVLADTTVRMLVRTHGQLLRQAETAAVDALLERPDLPSLSLQLLPPSQPRRRAGWPPELNADPGVQHDMALVLDELAPREDARYRHIEDNSASHVQSSMMGCSAFVFMQRGALVLGRWQGIYLMEFDGPRQRTVYVKALPDPPTGA